MCSSTYVPSLIFACDSVHNKNFTDIAQLPPCSCLDCCNDSTLACRLCFQQCRCYRGGQWTNHGREPNPRLWRLFVSPYLINPPFNAFPFLNSPEELCASHSCCWIPLGASHPRNENQDAGQFQCNCRSGNHCRATPCLLSRGSLGRIRCDSNPLENRSAVGVGGDIQLCTQSSAWAAHYQVSKKSIPQGQVPLTLF